MCVWACELLHLTFMSAHASELPSSSRCSLLRFCKFACQFSEVIFVCCFHRHGCITTLQANAALATKVFHDVSPVCSEGIRQAFQRLPAIISKYTYINKYIYISLSSVVCVCIGLSSTIYHTNTNLNLSHCH